jgi:hypothetical protein
MGWDTLTEHVGGDDRRFLQEYCGFVFGCSFRLHNHDWINVSSIVPRFSETPNRNKLKKKVIAQLL